MSNHTVSTDRPRLSTGAAILWASAMVIFALILIQASRISGVSTAYAGDVSKAGDYVVLTADAGNNEDVLLALDGRTDQLMVYSIVNGQQLQMRSKYKVSNFFQPQQQQQPGRRRR